MNQQALTSLFNRVFFIAAFVLFAVAVIEKICNWTGYSLIGMTYSPGRLFEFAGENGALASLRPGSTIIIMSTISPDNCQNLSAELADKNIAA